jgi:hypothetical protein
LPFTSVQLVEQTGGLDSADSYTLFWYADKPALDAVVLQYIGFAASWLKLRAGAAVYAAAALDADQANLFTLGETYIALHFLFSILQSRRVQGTHFPLQEEDSSRFEALIDVEWMKLANDLLEPYLTVEEEGKPFAMPVFLLGPVLDDSSTNTSLDSQEAIVESFLDRARSLSVGP